jgi:hypothetical protein
MRLIRDLAAEKLLAKVMLPSILDLMVGAITAQLSPDQPPTVRHAKDQSALRTSILLLEVNALIAHQDNKEVLVATTVVMNTVTKTTTEDSEPLWGTGSSNPTLSLTS